MTWVYNKKSLKEIPEGVVGFVYQIKNIRTGMLYLGKKGFFFSKTKQVKGKKKRTKVESDWRDYYGSNKQLQEHVNIFGQDKFERTILRMCKSKGEMSYFETKYIFEADAIISEQYYNEWCSCKINKSHLKNLKLVKGKIV